jgi:hypothetical protein
MLYPAPAELFLLAGHPRPSMPSQFCSAKPLSLIKQSCSACQARHAPFQGCKGFIVLIFH